MTARYIYRAQREPVLANKSHCCNTVGIPAGRPVSTYLENLSHSKTLSIACTFYVEKILQGWSEEADDHKKKFDDARCLPLFIYHNRIFGSQNVKVTRKAVAILLLFRPLGLSAFATKMSNGSLRNVLHRICSLFKSIKSHSSVLGQSTSA